MRQIFAKIGKTVLFLAIGLVLFLRIQDVLTPNWNNIGYIGRVVRGIDELGSEEPDVLLLGTSQVLLGVSPMKLYEEYGILSYSLTSSGQPMECSRLLLENALKSHSIKTVVLDVTSLFHDENITSTEVYNAYWRYVLDNLPLNALKCKMARQYAEYPDGDGFIGAMFPIVKYHSRWTELTKKNFYPYDKEVYYSFGQKMMGMVQEVPFTLDAIDWTVEELRQYVSGKTKIVTKDGIREQTIEEALYDVEMPEEPVKALCEIVNLCQEADVNLVLLKVPSMKFPQWYMVAWDRVKSSAVKDLAQEFGVPFYDLNYDAEFPVSPETDFADAGIHLNTRGAAKVSTVLGRYLIENGYAEPKSSSIYDEALEKYNKVFSVSALHTASDFREYLELLKEQKDERVIFVAASDEYTLGLTEDDYKLLSELGLTLISEGEFRDSYIGIIEQGETLYEAVSDYELEYDEPLLDEELSLISRNGWLTEPEASVEINGIEYAQFPVGLNFVVYDPETACVVDTVGFNTNEASKVMEQDGGRRQYLLEAYESALCFDGR